MCIIDVHVTETAQEGLNLQSPRGYADPVCTFKVWTVSVTGPKCTPIWEFLAWFPAVTPLEMEKGEGLVILQPET